MASRWRWPPLRSSGRRSAQAAGRPTASISSSARVAALARARRGPAMSSGSDTISAAVQARVEGGGRVLEDELDAVAEGAQAAAAQRQQVVAVEPRSLRRRAPPAAPGSAPAWTCPSRTARRAPRSAPRETVEVDAGEGLRRAAIRAARAAGSASSGRETRRSGSAVHVSRSGRGARRPCSSRAVAGGRIPAAGRRSAARRRTPAAGGRDREGSRGWPPAAAERRRPA